MMPARWLVVVWMGVVVLGCRFDGVGIRTDGAEGPCPGHVCECSELEWCAPSCPFDGCFLDCERLGTCEASCTDGCEASCSAAEACELSCDDGCAARCESAGDCVVTCGRDCEVVCNDVGSCSVAMIDGVAWCDRIGRCDVQCIDAQGGRAPAVQGVDGGYRCPPAVVLVGR